MILVQNRAKIRLIDRLYMITQQIIILLTLFLTQIDNNRLWKKIEAEPKSVLKAQRTSSLDTIPKAFLLLLLIYLSEKLSASIT